MNDKIEDCKAKIDKFIATHDMSDTETQLKAYDEFRDGRFYIPSSEMPTEFAHIDNELREAVCMWRYQNGKIALAELSIFCVGTDWLETFTGYPIGEIDRLIEDSEEQEDYEFDSDEMVMGEETVTGRIYALYQARLYATIAHPYERYVQVKITIAKCFAYKMESGEIEYGSHDSNNDLVEILEYDFKPIINTLNNSDFWGNLWKKWVKLDYPTTDEAFDLFTDKFSCEEWLLFESELSDMYTETFEPIAYAYDEFDKWWNIDSYSIPAFLSIEKTDKKSLRDEFWSERPAYAKLMIQECKKLGYIVIKTESWAWKIYDPNTLELIITIYP